MFVTVRSLLLLLAPLCVAELAVAQQDSLRLAVEEAHDAWLDRDLSRLVSASDTVRLHLPGVANSASLSPEQAARLLARYLKPARELRFPLRGIRALASDHAYAEMQRVYVVQGTSEEREETVFLGFRQINGSWRLREIRITP